MRSFFFAGLATILFSCNNSADKKDPNQVKDDTARMDIIPLEPRPPIEPAKLAANELPPSLEFKGKLVEAWKWTDDQGENVLVVSSLGPFDDKDEYGEEGQTTELYAAHYTRKGNDYNRVWNMKDVERSCPFDITAEFIPGSTGFTDLDKDGIAEFKLQYSVACRSDVSPATMKLVMVENGTKYGLAGNRWLKYSPEFKFDVNEKNVNLEKLPPLKDEMETILRTFGRYENEKEFASAPPEFINWARKEWLKHVIEPMGE